MANLTALIEDFFVRGRIKLPNIRQGREILFRISKYIVCFIVRDHLVTSVMRAVYPMSWNTERMKYHMKTRRDNENVLSVPTL